MEENKFSGLNPEPKTGWVQVNGNWFFMPENAPEPQPETTVASAYDNAPVQQPAYRQATTEPFTVTLPEEPVYTPEYEPAYEPAYEPTVQATSAAAGSYFASIPVNTPEFSQEPLAYTNYNPDINAPTPEEQAVAEEPEEYEDEYTESGENNKKMMVTMIILLVALLAMVGLFVFSYFSSDTGNIAEGFQNIIGYHDTDQYTLGDEQLTTVNNQLTTIPNTTNPSTTLPSATDSSTASQTAAPTKSSGGNRQPSRVSGGGASKKTEATNPIIPPRHEEVTEDDPNVEWGAEEEGGDWEEDPVGDDAEDY